MKLALLLLTLAAAPEPVVEAVQIRLAAPRPGEVDRLTAVIARLVGTPLSDKPELVAEKAVLQLGGFASVVCRVSVKRLLACSPTRARHVRRVRFEGLPPQLLESDLERRIFLRPGEPLRVAGGDDGRVVRQRKRIEDYLEREGFLGAKVEIRTEKVGRQKEVDVIVRITRGNFVKVRKVEVERFAPLDREAVRGRFAQMCARSDQLIRAFETGHTACFTRDVVRRTMRQMEDELLEQGYPEARIVVEPKLVPFDDSHECGAPELDAKSRGTRSPRCVDLTVRVDAGPLLRTLFTVITPDGRARRDRRHDPGLDLLALPFDTLADAGAFLARPVQHRLELPLDGAPDAAIDIRDLRASLTFRDARAVDEAEAELSTVALREALALRGYLDANIEVDYRNTPGVLTEIRYIIKTGHVRAVRDVRVTGNLSFTDDALKALDLAARPRTPWQSGFITPQMLEGDVRRIERFYLENGFSDVVVSSALLRGPGQFVDVRYRVSEGRRYLIAGIEFEGGAPELEKEVVAALEHCAALRPPPKTGAGCAGVALKPDALDQGDLAGAETQRVLGIYAANGYPHVRARVELSPRWTEAGPWIRVQVWQALPDREERVRPTRALLGEAFVRGNSRTRRNAILKDMNLAESARGQPLDPVAIAQGVSRLRRTGLFARIRHRFVAARESDGTVDLLVEVEERPVETVDLSLAVSTDNLLSIRTDYRDRNIAGAMLDLRAFLDLGLFVGRRSEAGFELRWPRIRGLDLDLNVKPFARYIDRPTTTLLGSPPDSGQSRARSAFATDGVRDRIFETGGSVGLEGRPFAKDIPALRLGVDYELSWSWVQQPADRVEPLSLQALQTLDGLLLVWDGEQTRTGTIAPFLRYTGIKNPFNPREGWTLDLTLRFGAPILAAQETFFLGNLTASGYLPVGSRVVLAGQVRVWYGATQLEPDILTSKLLISDLTVLGGDRTVRGYNKQDPTKVFGLNELSAEVKSGARTDFSYLGGIANLEVRVTVAKNLFLGDLLLAGFVDIGAVTDDLEDALPQLLRDRKLGASVGLGVRYVLPVGPISVDFGRSIVDNNGAVHIQFGHAF